MGKTRTVNKPQMGVRPNFNQAIDFANKIYGSKNLTDEERLIYIAEMIPGGVAANINNGDFKNTCAIRMSYVLNLCGLKIAYDGNKTVSGTIITDDNNNKKKFWFYYRVVDLQNFLFSKWGKPDNTFAFPTAMDVKDKKGLILFETQFSDASGHATLIDGTHTSASCYDHCYFYSQAYNTKKAYFWKLS